MSELSEREEQEFAVVVAALLAGRIDGQQAVASLVAQGNHILAKHLAGEQEICGGCGAVAEGDAEGWVRTDAPWCPGCRWLA